MGERGASARRLPRNAATRVGGYVRAHVRLTGITSGVVLALLVTAAVVWWPRGGAQHPAAASVPVDWRRPAVAADHLVDRTGVRLIRVALTGDGGLLDLRYQVVDPALASSVHDAQTPPAIVDETTGLVLHSLLMGHAHEGELKAAVTYYLVFENTGGWVHRGSSVTVLLGTVQVEHVVVR